MPLFGNVNTSETYNFQTTGGDVILTAFDRIQVRPTEITAQQMQRALMEMNLLQARFNNRGPNLWTVDLQSGPLTQGTASYSIPAATIMILDAWVRYGSPATDRILKSISRSDYAAFPNKTTQAFPTQFWFFRGTSPTITLYPVPDGNGPYTLYYYRFRSIQDATVANGTTIEIPTRWSDAFVAGLAHRLARIYRPELEQIRKMDADEAWGIAANEDVENAPVYIAPQLSGYFR